MQHVVIANYYAHADKADFVAEKLYELATASRGEAANLSYDISRNMENPSQFTIVEKYVNAAGFATHRETEHFQRIGLGMIIPCLEKREVIELQPLT